MESVAYNLNRKKLNLRFFEYGKTYELQNDERKERNMLSLVLTGDRNAKHWSTEQKESGFFFMKAMVNLVLKRLGIQYATTIPESTTIFSEALEYRHGNESLVKFGLVSEHILEHFDVKQQVLYAEFDWDQLIRLTSEQEIVFTDVPKYPEVKRDFALLLQDDITFDQVRSIAFNTERKLLKQVDLFDVYRGKNLPSGKKSYAISFIIQDTTKTLTDKQIDKIMSKLQQAYERELEAELR